MSRLRAPAFCVITLLAFGAGCSDADDGAAESKGAQAEPASGNDAGHATGPAAAAAGKNAASMTPTGASGANEQSRPDASADDPRAPTNGDPPRASTGEATPTESVGEDCFGGKADTMRHSAHCGACGNACAPVVLASALDWPVCLALNASTAFWLTSGTAAKVMSAPLAGGTPTTLADAPPSPSSIAIDATHVYWASTGTIYRVPLEGGTPTSLLKVQANAQGIAIDHEYVYWVETGDGDVGSVKKVPLAGGDPITLATIPGSDPLGIAIDSTHAYWTNGANSVDRLVLKVPLTGGEPITLVPGSSSAYAIAVDATGVYWAAHQTVVSGFGAAIASVVSKVPLDGGTPTTLATGTHLPAGLAIDGVSVYWTNASTSQVVAATPGTDGSVLSVPLAGGDTVMLGPDQDEPAAIATNGTVLCWTTLGSGQGSGSVKCLGTCNDGSCR